jgi:hypothetical protein
MKTKLDISTKVGKRITSVLFSIFILSLGFTYAQKTSFAGNWTFSESKSQLGEGRFRAPASKLVVTQNETTLSLERTGKNRDGQDVTSTEKYTLDGKECSNSGAMNNVKKSTVTWSSDNKTMTINSSSTFERDGNSMEIKTVEIFTLSADGKSLTINTTSTSQRGERKQTLVYELSK